MDRPSWLGGGKEPTQPVPHIPDSPPALAYENAPPIPEPVFDAALMAGELERGTSRFDSREQVMVGEPSPVVTTVPTSASYRRTPYRADTVIDGWDNDSMAVRGTTMRGHLHRFNGAPRQDEMVLAEDSGRVVVCVADGVSAAQYAHVGAAAVCRYAAAWLDQSRSVPLWDLDFRKLLEYANYGLVATAAQALGLVEPDPAAAADFATTLVVAVLEAADGGAGELWGRTISVGDSGCWILGRAGFVPLGAGKASADGLISHATSALPTTIGEVEPVDLTLWPGEALLVGTDGFGDPLGTGEGVVGDFFRSVLGDGPPALIHLAHALDFSRERFDDDRTLVAVYPTAAPS
ncbi:protein phosphatase 2C domain-containing protein [Gordonia sp. PP30]|uniref:protein phosphatase 2C domain-containing protein n=1 Tax=Gordonia sp. PP30 TaxID=2935861 RepID=UPI001FFF7016|nr:protein phosphatase 2C domain-containing protein [Gordonia sp. PP30]UQE76063.1 protein phosphatase 2C domain-containing protein [Gordonia sp. PP30]